MTFSQAKHVSGHIYSVTVFLFGLLLGCLILAACQDSAFLDAGTEGGFGVLSSTSGVLASRLIQRRWGQPANQSAAGSSQEVRAGSTKEGEDLAQLHQQVELLERIRGAAAEVANLKLELAEAVKTNEKLGAIIRSQAQNASSPGVSSSLGTEGGAAGLAADAFVKDATVQGRTQVEQGGAGPMAGFQCDTAQFQHLAKGMTVEGPCICAAGASCTLAVLSENETHWDTLDKKAQEILLYFLGPSRAVADLQANHFSPAKASWSASFRLWDAGEYQATILGGCTAAGGLEKLAEFTVTIVSGQGGGKLTPCSYGQGYRWLQNEKGEWEWTNYPCAPAVVAASDYAYLMRRKGYRRVLFIGDSHQRVLYQHLKFLLGAPIRDDDLNKPKHDMREVIHAGDPERELHLHFYWIDGIYTNGEFGCTDRGRYSGRNETNSYPQIQTGADVISLDAGHWTAYWCKDAWKAYNKHLPAYLDWGETLLSPQSRLVWRTAPSWMPECNRKYVKLAYVNRVALDAISSRPYAPFSSWDVEAPQFSELREGHYSWTTADETGKKVVMGGAVGEAVAKAFMTWSVHSLQ